MINDIRKSVGFFFLGFLVSLGKAANYWWCDTDRRKITCSDEALSQC